MEEIRAIPSFRCVLHETRECARRVIIRLIAPATRRIDASASIARGIELEEAPVHTPQFRRINIARV